MRPHSPFRAKPRGKLLVFLPYVWAAAAFFFFLKSGKPVVFYINIKLCMLSIHASSVPGHQIM